MTDLPSWQLISQAPPLRGTGVQGPRYLIEGQPAAKVEHWVLLPSTANEVVKLMADLEELDKPLEKLLGCWQCRVKASGSTC